MKQKRKQFLRVSWFLICFMIITTIFSSVCYAKETESKTVRVAYVLAPGYQEGEEGEYKTGYGYEYLQRLAEINDWNYEYVYGSFSELLEKLENGEVDLMGNLSYTEERAKTISYGKYEQGKENYYLYGNRNYNVIDAMDSSSINGKRIGANTGTNQEIVWEEWCKEHNITCEIVEFDKSAERKEALNNGEIDAAIGVDVQQNEETIDWQVLLNFGSAPYYFGVSKDRPDLLTELNNAQEEILKENFFYNEEVHSRYMKPLALTTTKLNEEEKQWLQNNDKLIKVGYLDGFQPLSYSDKNGDFKGVAADMLTAMSEKYAAEGVCFETVRFKDYTTMLSALKSGEISAAWMVYGDYWNADQNGFALTNKVITTSMMLVFDSNYTAQTIQKIGVNRAGSLSEVYAKINYPESEIVEFDSYQDTVAALTQGEVTSILYETSVYQVNEILDENLHTFSSVTLPQTFDLSFAVSRNNKELVAILNKGITMFGDAGVDHALLVDSTVERKITMKDYFDQNPFMAIVLIGSIIIIAAGIVIFVVYKNMSIRVKTSQAEKEVYEQISNSDPLTGLYNRKAVFHKCQELLKEYPDEQFVMTHFDMVHFRLFNTFFGDEAGDQLLCDIADLFRVFSKEYDHWAYGRIEADVFCAFLPYDQKKYQKNINELLLFFKHYRSDFLVEPKLGVFFVADPAMPIEAMFTRATLASREVQPHTPYATVIYNEELERELNEKQQVINEMQMAIDQEQFKVYLQPKYSLSNNKMVGAEALVRWIHPTKGMISPAKFIPVFESNGFVTELDRYMWEHVCKLLSKWKKEGKTIVPVSVNVSRLSMYGTSTVIYLKNLVKKYNIDPKYLELELTESAYMDNPDEMKVQMYALRTAGFTILLDDFGSGYSSLNTLRELPVDILKLDMKFLSEDQQDRRGELVISSIIHMTKLLKLSVIAEGVELQKQADFLKSIGCEYVQGFLFARPMPVAEYEKMLTESNEPLVDVNQPMIDHIGKILAETENGTHAMGTVIPVPLVCLEYSNRKFTFMRVNPAFYTEFNLEEVEPASVVFEKRLTEESYNDLVNAIEESINTGKKVKVRIIWNTKNKEQQEYLCYVVYEGNIATTATIVAVFINITE